MTVAWLGAIQWDHPTIVGPIAAAITAGLFAIVLKLVRRRKPSDDASVGGSPIISPQITVAPKTDIEVKPVISPVFKQGLDEKDVGDVVRNAVEPVAQGVDSSAAEVMAHITAELAKAQLAPKQPVPDSEDALSVKAVEIYNDGVDAQNQDEAGQAIGHYLAALKLDPDFAFAHNNLAVELKAKGDLDGAIERWNEALRIEPHDADTHNNLGIALIAKGDFDAAIEHCNEALRIDPDDAGAHYNLGCALSRKKSPSAAVMALSRAIELDVKYRGMAKSDTDYDPIRNDPAFRKLVYGE